MPRERRKTRRHRVLRRGRVVLPGGRSTLDCVILDMSPLGALIRTDQWLFVPERFDLLIDHGPERAATVRHRTLDRAGLEFTNP